MMELHVPIPIGDVVRGRVSLASQITAGLDAVVLNHEASTIYPGWICLILDGNPRDLATASVRAAELGGVID